MSSSPELDKLDDALNDTVNAVGSFIIMTYIIMIVTLAVVLFIYWKFVCWVGSRTNVNNCLTLFIISMIADSIALKGNTSVALLVMALLRIDLGNLLSSPTLAANEFVALKSGKLMRPTSVE